MKRGHVPIRTCRGCGRKAPKNELKRFVLEQKILIANDQAKGYGYYCCPDNDCRTKMHNKLRKQKIV